MAKKESGKVISKKKNLLDFLKFLTGWIRSKHRNREKMIEVLYSFANKNKSGLVTQEATQFQKSMVFKRILSYCYNSPHIIWYFNKYLNDMFKFGTYKTIDLIDSMMYVMDINGQTTNKKLYFHKSNDLKDDDRRKVKKTTKTYFQIIHNRYLNDLELGFYYKLFAKGILPTSTILEMDMRINGTDKPTITLTDPLSYSEPADKVNEEDIKKWIESERIRPLAEPIQKFVDELKQKKPDRKECQSCKLYDKPIVVLDTNLNDFGPVDLAFIALNPGKDEITYGKPLVGRAGTHHRSKMFFLNPNTKWLLTNVFLCHTANQKEISSKNKEIILESEKCRDLLQTILRKFPADYYVPMGDIACKVFGIKGSIKAISGDVISSHNHNIVPLIHPSAVIQYHGANEQAYNRGFNTLYELMDQKYSKQNIVQTNTISSADSQQPQQTTQVNELPTTKGSVVGRFNLPTNKLIDTITDDLTLFDIVNLDGYNVLMIYIDDNGQKKYKIQDYNLPIFIKNAHWKDCTFTTDSIDQICYINGNNKFKVSRAARDILTVSKNSCILKDG